MMDTWPGKCEYRFSDPWLFNHRRSYTNLLPPNRRADLYQLFLAINDYQLFLVINDIEHTKTKVKSPQTNGIYERFHKTILQEFYQVTFRKKIYEDIDQLQNDLDLWIDHYNNERTHQGKVCEGRTPMQSLEDGKEIWKEKFVD